MRWLDERKNHWNPGKSGAGWMPLLGMLLALGLAGCAGGTRPPTATPTLPGALTPYYTPTPTRTPRPPTFTPTSPFSPTPTATITPTPFLYTIKSGDTLGALALRYAVSVKEIEAANPGVNARLLIIGQTLVIPLHPPEITPTISPTPTAAPVALDAPVCYPSADGGLWCLALAYSAEPTGVENLTARITLFGPAGEILEEQTALPPLNLLPVEQSLPVVAFFPAPLPAAYVPQIELLSALRVAISDTRYISAPFSLSGVKIAPDGLSATIEGEVLLPESSAASVVWVAAAAYDAAGAPVGVRKIESEQPCAGWGLPAPETETPAAECRGERLPFKITVYSLGPAIARVEVLVEARP